MPNFMRTALATAIVTLVGFVAAASASAAGAFTPGNLYVADRPIREFTPDGALVRTLGDARLQQPSDLAFDPSGSHLYVTDVGAGDVKVIDGSGAVIAVFGAGVLAGPRGIAVGRDGTVYVADTGGNDIDVFDAAGAHLRTIAPVAAPLNVVLDAGGTRLLVTQSVYGTGVHVFGVDGADFGVYGQTAGSVLLTNGIAFGRDGVLYVGDGAFGGYTGSVKSFDASGAATGTFADGLNAPFDIAVDAAGNVWETNANDFAGNQIREYATSGALMQSFGSGLLQQPTGLAFVPVPDATPPSVSATIGGQLGANGWYVTDVSVGWVVSDAESTPSFSCPQTRITADTSGATISCTATSAGGTATGSVTIKRDATAPTTTYANNAGTYTVDQTVDISCRATDAGSGVATDTCARVNAPAYSFALGVNALSSTAVDVAGNTGFGSTMFTVAVTPRSLCNLTLQLVRKPAPSRLCADLDTLAAGLTPTQKAAAITAYGRALNALEKIGALTPVQALLLRSLAAAL